MFRSFLNDALRPLYWFGRGWVLVSSSRDWCEAARHSTVALTPVLLGELLDVRDRESVEEDFGIGEHGASLVRPDGVIAWRTTAECSSVDALQSITNVVARARCR